MDQGICLEKGNVSFKMSSNAQRRHTNEPILLELNTIQKIQVTLELIAKLMTFALIMPLARLQFCFTAMECSDG